MDETDFTDGDVLAIGAGLQWTLAACWPLLAAVDRTLSPSPLAAVLSRLKALGVRPDTEHPSGPLQASSPDIRAAMASLRAAIDQVRRAGAIALQDPRNFAGQLSCTVSSPRWWYRIPDPAPAGRVQLVHQGDLPPGHPALHDLARADATASLVALVLAGSSLTGWRPPTALLDIPGLRMLDVAGCGLSAVPELALRNPSIEVLQLNGNRLRDAAPLEDPACLPHLRAVFIARCGLPPEAVQRLREARPGVQWVETQ